MAVNSKSKLQVEVIPASGGVHPKLKVSIGEKEVVFNIDLREENLFREIFDTTVLE